MASMTWPDIIGDDRFTKRYVDELDGNGNQIYIGKAPVVNANGSDDGWWIRKQFFDASNKLTGYQEFTGVWARRSTYVFGPQGITVFAVLRMGQVVVTNSKKFRYAKVAARVSMASTLRPMPVNYGKVVGAIRMRSYTTPSKNWSTVVTKVRRVASVGGLIIGSVKIVGKLKMRKVSGTQIKITAKVVATKQ